MKKAELEKAMGFTSPKKAPPKAKKISPKSKTPTKKAAEGLQKKNKLLETVYILISHDSHIENRVYGNISALEEDIDLSESEKKKVKLSKLLKNLSKPFSSRNHIYLGKYTVEKYFVRYD